LHDIFWCMVARMLDDKRRSKSGEIARDNIIMDRGIGKEKPHLSVRFSNRGFI